MGLNAIYDRFRRFQNSMSTYQAVAKPYRGWGMEGSVAKWYAKLTGKSIADFKARAKQVAEQISPGSKVLEVAPGPGYFAIELAKFGEYQVTGLDISRTFVEIARQNAARANLPVDFRQGNASAMPFPDETFDFLFCQAAFKNFAQPLAALREMYRVLKPGGKALIIDLRRDASMDSIGEAIKQMHLGPVNRIVTKLTFRFMLLKRAYTEEAMRDLVSRTKFRNVEIRERYGIAMEVGLERAAESAQLRIE